MFFFSIVIIFIIFNLSVQVLIFFNHLKKNYVFFSVSVLLFNFKWVFNGGWLCLRRKMERRHGNFNRI